MKKTISEVFDDFKNAKTREDKIHILRSNYTFSLKYILQGTFHPEIEFVFETIPQYKKSGIPDGMGYTTIDQELGRAYIFERNNPRVNPNLSQKRKTELLIQVLEALEDREAVVFEQMLLKKLLIPGLTYDIVKEAFPELLPDVAVAPEGTAKASYNGPGISPMSAPNSDVFAAVAKAREAEDVKGVEENFIRILR